MSRGRGRVPRTPVTAKLAEREANRRAGRAKLTPSAEKALRALNTIITSHDHTYDLVTHRQIAKEMYGLTEAGDREPWGSERQRAAAACRELDEKEVLVVEPGPSPQGGRTIDAYSRVTYPEPSEQTARGMRAFLEAENRPQPADSTNSPDSLLRTARYQSQELPVGSGHTDGLPEGTSEEAPTPPLRVVRGGDDAGDPNRRPAWVDEPLPNGSGRAVVTVQHIIDAEKASPEQHAAGLAAARAQLAPQMKAGSEESEGGPKP